MEYVCTVKDVQGRLADNKAVVYQREILLAPDFDYALVMSHKQMLFHAFIWQQWRNRPRCQDLIWGISSVPFGHCCEYQSYDEYDQG